MSDQVKESEITDYWSPAYKAAILSELDEAITMLERVRDWFDAVGVRYVLRDDVSALITRLRR